MTKKLRKPADLAGLIRYLIRKAGSWGFISNLLF